MQGYSPASGVIVTDLCYVLLFEKLAIKYAKVSKAESFYDVKNGSSTITSKSSSKNLGNENKHTMSLENLHFDSRFVLKTTKTPVFVFTIEIL